MKPDRTLVNTRLCSSSTHQNSIVRVVCSGGGAKGVVYPGAYKAMEVTGILPGIKAFAGSSAGAITAALMAVGMSSSALRDTLLSTNLRDLMGDNVGHYFRKNKPGVCFITKDGKPIEEFIRSHIINTVIISLSSMDKIDILASQNPDLKRLMMKLGEVQAQFTFGDLALLNRLFPETFKKVIITAVKFPSGDIQIFDTEQTPEVEIALACRASASLPVILEPVVVMLNGKKQRFIDGGMYDNLPTDYFDRDASLRYIKNTIPEQTLVFAFGGGNNNLRNNVFKALYGERWNEVINEKFLKKTITMAYNLYQNQRYLNVGFYSTEEKSQVFIYVIKAALDQFVKDNKMTLEGALTVLSAIKKSLNIMVDKNPIFLQLQDHEAIKNQQIRRMTEIVHEKLKPSICNPSKLDVWKRTVLVKKLGDVQAPYNNTTREELCYQKIRKDYALRTVELRVGNIKTLDFNDATKFARVMDAFGYLDTINHISSHDLHDPIAFNADAYYVDLVFHFDCIYHAVLNSAGKKIKNDPLTKETNALRKQLEALNKSPSTISRQIYQFLKMNAEMNLNSIEAFALSRAVEFLQNTLKPEDLFEETYKEGFKRSHLISQSQITGQSFFRTASLERSLKGKSMYDLYAQKDHSKSNTRSDKTFNILKQIGAFRESYSKRLQETDEFEHFFQL